MSHYYNFYIIIYIFFLTFCSDHTGIPYFRINKIAFLLKTLNFAHYFNHALINFRNYGI